VRNQTAASLIGYLLRLGARPDLVLDLVHGWNLTKNTPPLPDAEIVRTVESIATRELTRRGGRL
jgi:hypothetical protein